MFWVAVAYRVAAGSVTDRAGTAGNPAQGQDAGADQEEVEGAGAAHAAHTPCTPHLIMS